MKHNDYECRQCGAHFNSKAELQRHNKDQHSMHGRGASGSSSESQSDQRAESSGSRMSEDDRR